MTFLEGIKSCSEKLKTLFGKPAYFSCVLSSLALKTKCEKLENIFFSINDNSLCEKILLSEHRNKLRSYALISTENLEIGV